MTGLSPAAKASDPDAAVRAHYAKMYRPPENPGRLYVGTRLAAGLAGSEDGAGGRAAVLRAEVGHTWNVIGYAVGATMIAGALEQVVDDDIDQYPLLIGGGPSLSLGRLSLLRRSFFDVRLAYDFLYGKVYRDGQPYDEVAPHGPRVDLDLGLLAIDSETRRRRHGFGATVGFQRILGSFAATMAPSNLLTVGAVYKFS